MLTASLAFAGTRNVSEAPVHRTFVRSFVRSFVPCVGATMAPWENLPPAQFGIEIRANGTISDKGKWENELEAPGFAIWLAAR
jgi:hypothetical protein